jgi:hypothetical protein
VRIGSSQRGYQHPQSKGYGANFQHGVTSRSITKVTFELDHFSRAGIISAACQTAAENRRSRSAANEAKQDHHDRDDKKNVNESAHGVRGNQTQQPQDDQDDCNSLKHVCYSSMKLLSDCFTALINSPEFGSPSTGTRLACIACIDGFPACREPVDDDQFNVT